MKTPALTLSFWLATGLFAAEWPVYEAPDKQFTITMPGKVTVKRGQNRYPFGVVTITAHSHKQDDDTIWRVATHDYPEEFMKATPPGKLLDLMAKGMAKNVKGDPAALKAIKAIKLDKYEGREFKVNGAGPGGHSIHTRLYVVGIRVYQLTLVAKPDAPALKESQNFLDPLIQQTNSLISANTTTRTRWIAW